MQEPIKTITVRVHVPASMPDEEARRFINEATIMQLYAQSKITSGRAAHMLGISRWEFLDLTGKYHVSIFDDDLDIDEEIKHAGQVADHFQP